MPHKNIELLEESLDRLEYADAMIYSLLVSVNGETHGASTIYHAVDLTRRVVPITRNDMYYETLNKIIEKLP